MRPPLIQRIYTSTASYPFSDQQIRDLLVECRINNLINQITGLLIYGNQTFFQVLEGPAENVEELWRKILRDPRHLRVKQLLSRETPKPLFKDWSMAFEKLDSPLASQINGLSDLFAEHINEDHPLPSEKEVILLVDAFSQSLCNISDPELG